MTLEKLLPPSTKYIPVDVVARDRRTVVVDLNQQPLPARVQADAVAGLGLLSYLFDVPGLLSACAQQFRVAVFSYNPVDLPGAAKRRLAHAWVNSYSRAALEETFTHSGFAIVAATILEQRQVVWRLESKRKNGPAN